MSQDWYYSANNAQQGPISAAELRKLALNGTLKPTDLVWKDGMAEWTPAQSIKGLFAPPPAAAPKPAASSSPPLPDLPPIPDEMAKPKKSGSLRDRLDNVPDKGRKKAVEDDEDDIVEVDDEDVVEEEKPKRSRRRDEEDDEEDRPRSRRRRDEDDEEERPRRKRSSSRPSRGNAEIPTGIKIAGFIWMAVGAFAILSLIMTFVGPNGPGESKIPTIGCNIFIITAFISAGLSSIRGTATSRALIGNAIGSIFFSLIYLVLCVLGLFVQDRVGGEAKNIVLIVLILAGLLGTCLMTAGVLALINKSAYDDYLDGGRSQRRNSRREYEDEDEAPRRRRR